jgi:D-lactate dehydrogenase
MQPFSIMQPNFTTQLQHIVGKNSLITDPKKTASYRKGYRFGHGKANAVIVPNSLLELWTVVQACVDADVIILMQAANTGLTGGSTPYGDYDRDVVIISTVKLSDNQLINNAEQVIAFPGSRLYELESELAQYNREPNSVIGSSCIGASVVGGVCNNSGGALVHRGPAYTEMALYAQIDENQQLRLVNHLGIDLGEDPEDIIKNLQAKNYQASDIHFPERLASDQEYLSRIREIDADTPARFNNDERRLYEASGCAGKLIVLAVRLDTFPKAKKEQVFYIGTNDPSVLTVLRRHMLQHFEHLPVAGEYLHSTYFDACDRYGKDTFIAIQRFGSEVMPRLFRLKSTIDRVCSKLSFLPVGIADKLLQGISQLFPDHLPKRMRDYRQHYEHHLLLHMADGGVEEASEFLEEFFKSQQGDYFECSEKEGKLAFLHRFVAGGAVPRYKLIKSKQFGEHVSLDIALKRNEQDWFEKLPADLDELIEEKFYCGHFFCHVMHQDYLLKKGVDGELVKQRLLNYLDEKGAEYPAEHNVGQLYEAKDELRSFYQKNDPTNSLNPGIGKTSKYKYWVDEKIIKRLS